MLKDKTLSYTFVSYKKPAQGRTSNKKFNPITHKIWHAANILRKQPYTNSNFIRYELLPDDGLYKKPKHVGVLIS